MVLQKSVCIVNIVVPIYRMVQSSALPVVASWRLPLWLLSSRLPL